MRNHVFTEIGSLPPKSVIENNDASSKLGQLCDESAALVLSLFPKDFCTPPVQKPHIAGERLLEMPSQIEEVGSLENTTKGWPRADPVTPLDTDPIWSALGRLKRLLELLPETFGGVSRLDQCVSLMRGTTERDQFPDSIPDGSSGDSIRLIQYPHIEINWFIEATRPAIVSLLESVDLEKTIRLRLHRELEKGGDFLESDDRGTIAGYIDSTGSTAEKVRNNSKLDSLAAFLHALRRQPYAAIRFALTEMDKLAVPPTLLSADLANSTVRFQSTDYPVSELTCHFIRLLISAHGGLVTSTDVSVAIPGSGKVRTDRLKKNLPKRLVKAIETTKNGSRLLLDQLLSHA
jgi:hypothetical protein